ncbi:MAG: hypothetical protein IKL25_02125 [Clostridia bacterium]|nr:hypothetical protein [Clostridia bacterium]
MMKKMLCLLVFVLLLPVAALAEDSVAPVLTYRELVDWAEGFIARARTAQPLNDPSQHLTPDGYEYIYDFATLYGDTPQMSADTVITAVVITSSEENGPRNVNVGNAMSVVVDAYYNENPSLLGTKDAAVLYAVDQLPESAQWAQVLREGQRVKRIQYAVHEQYATGGEGYTDAGVIYTMNENRVIAIRVYGLDSRIGLDVVNNVMYTAMVTALEKSYAQVPFSYNGEELEVFSAKDLVFSGINFLNITPDEAIALLGEPLKDEWVDNGDDGYIRVQTFASCELIYIFNEERTQGHVYMLAINADGLEGPRAVRIGDSYASVYNRFRNGEGEFQEDGTEVLYGAEGAGEFGTAIYGYDASVMARYGFILEDGRTVVLQMEFTVMECTGIMLYVE